jgi:hypothetical protein
MTETEWPWSPEEEARWWEELRVSEIAVVAELFECMANNGWGSAYDPLYPQEESEPIHAPETHENLQLVG